MSRTYEALYEDGEVKWLNDAPPQKSARHRHRPHSK